MMKHGAVAKTAEMQVVCQEGRDKARGAEGFDLPSSSLHAAEQTEVRARSQQIAGNPCPSGLGPRRRSLAFRYGFFDEGKSIGLTDGRGSCAVLRPVNLPNKISQDVVDAAGEEQ